MIASLITMSESAGITTEDTATTTEASTITMSAYLNVNYLVTSV